MHECAPKALAIPGRLELPTYGLGNRRSIRLSYGTANLLDSRCLDASYQSERSIASPPGRPLGLHETPPRGSRCWSAITKAKKEPSADGSS
jgi:hypothetical protein